MASNKLWRNDGRHRQSQTVVGARRHSVAVVDTPKKPLKMSSNIRIEKICEFCNETFTAKTLVTKYCSHKCSSRAHKLRLKSVYIEAMHPPPPSVEAETAKPDYLEIDEAAKEMRVSVRTLFRLIAAGKLKRKKILSRTVILKKDIKLFFKQQ